MGREANASTLRGIGLPNSRHKYSTRFRASENSALNKRCSNMLSRRMSSMKAIAGWTAAMYEKFWSGPTPIYTPPRTPSLRNPSVTWRYDVSFEMMLSESKKPPDSDSWRTRRAKVVSRGAATAMDCDTTADWLPAWTAARSVGVAAEDDGVPLH